LEILKFLAKLSNTIAVGETPTINDALEVLKFLAKLSSVYSNSTSTTVSPPAPSQNYLGEWYSCEWAFNQLEIIEITADKVSFDMYIYKVGWFNVDATITSSGIKFDDGFLKGTLRFSSGKISITIDESKEINIDAGDVFEFSFREKDLKKITREEHFYSQDANSAPGAEPSITLYPNGEFKFHVNVYDGFANIYGTYKLIGHIFYFNVTRRDSGDWLGDDVDEFEMRAALGNSLRYSPQFVKGF